MLDECLAIAREFKPDLILYDFCALEGHFAGRILGVPPLVLDPRHWSGR